MYKILIIDNNKNDCTTLRKMLIDYNPEFEIFTCDCGAEGLKMINNYKPNFVFMNMTLPLLDGIEICNIVKNRLNIKDIKTILISKINNIKKEDIMNMFLADDYLEKPYDQTKVLNLMDEILNQY